MDARELRKTIILCISETFAGRKIFDGPQRSIIWCPWPGSNQHSLRNSILSRARLPIPPQGRFRGPESARIIAVRGRPSTALVQLV